MPLSRLLYTSQCTLDDSDPNRMAAVHEIAEAASAANIINGLTGSLIYVDNEFIQVLEGRADQIETIFERICCDFRHRDVRLIDLVPIKERLFSEWGMALLSDDKDTVVGTNGNLEEIRLMVGVNAREAIHQIRNTLDMQVSEQMAACQA